LTFIPPFCMLARMKPEKPRTMVRESDSKPFKICMDDGRSYIVNHPDFAMVADGRSSLAAGRGASSEEQLLRSVTLSTFLELNH
jgi:hypothetical protein